jgi:hypothetical protein
MGTVKAVLENRGSPWKGGRKGNANLVFWLVTGFF